ncbi:MAG: hypothetical protein ACRCXD_06080 [Luteolibacter sp.]
MNPKTTCGVLGFALAFFTMQPATAQLPSLSVDPWLGFFAGEKTSRCTFGIASDGEIHFTPAENATRANGGWSFRMRPVIEETTPEGKIVVRELVQESLKTSQPAANKIEKVIFTGDVKGGGTLEMTVEQSRNNFLIGGRVVEPGPGKNLKRFALIGRSPRFYAPYETGKGNKTEEEKALQAKRDKTLEKKVEGETLNLKLLDGKMVKQPILEPADLASAAISGVGISEIGMELQLYQGRELVLTASPNSAFALSLEKGSKIFKRGFSIFWRPDPEKDAGGAARMAISSR